MSTPRSSAFVDAELPSEYARLLAVDAHGACVFHDAEQQRCAIHHALGPAAKPLSCRAFPLIIVHDPRGVSISLSHYCPSAADLLFASAAIELVDVDVSAPAPASPQSQVPASQEGAAKSIEIQDLGELGNRGEHEEPEGLDGRKASGALSERRGLADRDKDDDLRNRDDFEGLDAREALPPLLRDDVLVDWESLTRWERHVAAVLDGADSPGSALACLWHSHDPLQTWRSADGPLADHVDRVARSTVPFADGTVRISQQAATGPIAVHVDLMARSETARPAAPSAAPATVIGDVDRGDRIVGTARPAPGAAPAVARVGVGAAGRSFDDASLVAAVLSAIPASLRPSGVGVSAPERRDGSPAPHDELLRRHARPLCRYLAARAHACWPLHQGAHGLRSQLVYLEAALAVVHRHLTTTSDVREAIRCADLWLVHLASPVPLASALDSLLPPLPPR